MSALLCAGAAIGLASGCLVVNTKHCGYKENGADNPCPDGFVCSVCAVENNGCVPIDQKDTIQQSCFDSGASTDVQTGTTTPTTGTTTPPLTTSTVTTETSTTDTTTTTGTGSETDTTEMTSMSSSTTMPIECDPDMGVVNDMCTPKYCLPSGTCGTCDQLPQDVTCESLDPNKKVCDGDKGFCVECTKLDISACTVDEPVCGPDGQCTPCSEHFECPTEACDIETGQCFPPENVYYVKGALNCPGADGTFGMPFCNLNQVPLDPGVPTTIKVIAGGSAPPGYLDVQDGRIVAVIRHDKQTPDINGSSNVVPTISVTGPNSRVYLSLLKFSLAQTSSILKCQSQGILYAYDTQVTGNGMNSARAIDSSLCKLRLRRSVVRDNGAGILANGGDVVVETSYVIGNGNNNSFGAFNFVNAVKARILYSTVVANKATNTTSTFTCTGAGQDVVVRNSAVVGLDPLATTDCFLEEGGEIHESPDANDQSAVISAWFTDKQGLYAPKNSMGVDPLEDQAMWGDGDPALDYDRAPIPTDEPTFAGADQPPMN